MKEFEERGASDDDAIFSELCFCILTANFNAERAIRIQEGIGRGFISLEKEKLASELRRMGHRYPNMRAEFIFEARKWRKGLKKLIKSMEERRLREYLAKNVKGLGFKEASHFLRNIGFKNLAIIDFHIIDVLVSHEIINSRPKSLTKSKYEEIEEILGKIAEACGITQAELDLFLWYMETGKILK